MFSFDTYNYTSNRFTKSPNTYHATGRDANGNLIYEQTRQGTENLAYSLSAKGDRTIYLEAALNYKNTFGRHDVSGMLLFNQSDEINTKATNVEEALPYRFRGLAGRFTYGFDDRYFAEFNFGYNGSENFTPKNRYGFFPSVGLGWVISNESFFEPLTNVIQYLKVRGTWGQVGNSQISGRRFAYLATVTDSSSTSYTFGKNMDQNYGHRRICRRRDMGGGRQDRHRRGHAPVEQQAQPPIRLLQGVPRGHLPPPFEHSFLRRNDQQPLRQYRKGREQGLRTLGKLCQFVGGGIGR